jgi:hypothetical protein
MISDSAALVGLLGKRLDDTGVRDLFLDLNGGAEPVAHIAGNASIGESRTYLLPVAGVIVRTTDYSGAGQRIGQVTLIGKARRVYLDGREYALEAFRGSLPLSLRWGKLRTEIRRQLGCPAGSNDGISISDRPKAPIHETRDADEYMQGSAIIRLIYSDSYEGPGYLEEIDVQRTIDPTRP